MNKPYLKIKILNKKAKNLEKREEDAGYDIYAIFEKDIFILKPNEIFLFPTGLALEFPKNWVFFIAERGSTGTKGIAKRCGIVDSGYRGEVFIPINNTSNKPIIFYKNEETLNKYVKNNKIDVNKFTLYPQYKAIAQGFLLFTPHIEVEIVERLSESERGDNALGSTNK